MASESTSQTITPPSSPKGLLGIPIELQKRIFANSRCNDLIALALVSKHFHSIASAQIYRDFNIGFPSDDMPGKGGEIDCLAGGLDTLTTSEHNYAQHLREIRLDTHGNGERAERAYQDYSYALSCGKFLNTLLALTLSKACALETFNWNIRVELSRPVFNALHNISSLRHLHVRLQRGASLYESPIPFSELLSTDKEKDDAADLRPVKDIWTLGLPSVQAKSSSKVTWGNRRRKPGVPPTFAGFKNLSSLAVLDLESLDYASDVSSCIKSSSLTLKSLQLSLSNTVGRRTKPFDEDDDTDSDEDVEDLDHTMPVLLPSAPLQYPESAEDREERMRAESARVESLLASFLQVDKKPQEGKLQAKGPKRKGLGHAKEVVLAPSSIEALRNATSQALVERLQGHVRDFLDDAGNLTSLNGDIEAEVLSFAEKIEKLRKQEGFVDESSMLIRRENIGGTIVTYRTPVTSEATGSSGQSLPIVREDETNNETKMEAAGRSDGNENHSVKGKGKETKPSPLGNTAGTPAGGVPPNHKVPTSSKATAANRDMKNYVRSTRKLTLESVGFSGFPVKGSVLSRALDLTTLKQIAVFKAGSQAVLWGTLEKEHRTTGSLRISRISTDDVSPSFLTFVNSLDAVTDLLLLKRSMPVVGEPSNPISIREIRKQALKKHIKSLQKLMIRCEKGRAWDLDAKTIRLLALKGQNLKELAFQLDLDIFHQLLQYLPGLAALEALHIIHFRTDEVCSDWLVRELRKFVIDVVAQNPAMMLKYVAIGSTVERLNRIKHNIDPGAKGAKPDGKSKIDLDKDEDAKDEDDEDSESSMEEKSDKRKTGGQNYLMKIADGDLLKVDEVRGVDVFRKDVRAGKL
ncbi:MAG: hypothetical protein M1825_001583 [Sarcosagium campestre]|nr:MAG: hypothetical protein M1825_001583 [Sarcosagium campestre]